MKKVIRLTESDLSKMVNESVKQIIKENPNNEGLRDLWRYTMGNAKKSSQGAGQRLGSSIRQKVDNYKQYQKFGRTTRDRLQIANQLQQIIPILEKVRWRYDDEVDSGFMMDVEDYLNDIIKRFSQYQDNFQDYESQKGQNHGKLKSRYDNYQQMNQVQQQSPFFQEPQSVQVQEPQVVQQPQAQTVQEPQVQQQATQPQKGDLFANQKQKPAKTKSSVKRSPNKRRIYHA